MTASAHSNAPIATAGGAGNYEPPLGDLRDSLSRLVSMDQWPFAQAGISGGDILVAEQVIIDALGEVATTTQVKMLTPGAVTPDIFASGCRVFVLCLCGELAYARKLKHEFPDATIVSATYGDLASPVELASMAANGLDMTVVVSSPCSGSGYLLDLVYANKLAESSISMEPAEAMWAKCQHDFNLVRWVASKLGETTTHKNHHIILKLDLGLIDDLDARGLLAWKKSKFFLTAAEARLLYMTRRNRADQIALIETGTRPAATEPDAEALLPLAMAIIGAEARYENLFSELPYFRTVTFEELAESPIEVVKMLTVFFERQALRNVSVTDPAAQMIQARWKDSFRSKFNAAAVKLLALSKNAQGSYHTKTEHLFADKND